MVGLRPGHRLAGRDTIALSELAHEVLGTAPEALFTLQWNPSRAHAMAAARFVHCALAADLPAGWYTQPDHLHHTAPDEYPADTHPSPQRH